MPELRIGTSGWTYDEWEDAFYPEDVSRADHLAYYGTQYNSVEINGTFYRYVERDRFEEWAGAVPDDFVFSVKAHRYFTHRHYLMDPKGFLSRFLDTVCGLGDKAGPVLFQFPGRWNKNTDRLADFLDMLDAAGYPFRYAFECRRDTWWDDTVYELLKRRNAAWCLWDIRQEQPPEVVTADFVYIRLHGPKKGPYGGAYPKQALEDRASSIKQWLDEGLDVYCYFDNTANADAVNDARRLREVVEG